MEYELILAGLAPRFLQKYPSQDNPAISQFTEDMPEVLRFLGMADSHWELKAKALSQLRGGYRWAGIPFCCLCKTFVEAGDINTYLTSQEFVKCYEFTRV